MNLPLYFISDVHLRLTASEEESGKRESIIRFIEHITEKKGTLFIIGDFFDFWFEYKYVIPKAYFRVLTALYHAKEQGIEIHYVLGNHDYWVRDFIEQTIFTHVHRDNINFEVNGQSFYITHGDGILGWDKGYRIMRKVIRNKTITALFRWIHPDLGYTIARWISRTGRPPIHSNEYNTSVIDELESFSEDYWQNGINHVIFGHYHQVKQIVNNKGTLTILGDWIKHRSFALFDGEEFTLNYWRE